jgi:hypothetical protein
MDRVGCPVVSVVIPHLLFLTMDKNWENEEFWSLMAESKYNDLLNAGIQWSSGIERKRM